MAEHSISLAVLTPTIGEVDGGDKKENSPGRDFVNMGGNTHSIREEGKVSVSNKDNKETTR
ncbi:hypothetical protein NC653_012433 [Populus alba x Populus x berolinensis]|uniref:Uncharacterized protein n=1 Tax=Populus alba x Populus x berolinensis TaxID=444605 RepID=A0AAD6W6A4_9ROSI|nr:hypothetical protein NC653_011359 [Populus alba x Populus x berolinensis]KAJ7000890.1 hypothetical protein NC653_011367 [Populus alba x Populus x berolinensis]KAJ7002374.1 hypothetical protein NC653_012433 [Populus alba x Populus x berolinensis]